VAIKIKLLQGETLIVHADAETWDRAFREALSSGGMVQVQGEDGHVLAINPQQVVYLEEVPDELAQREPEADREPEPVGR
jgi:hypothetical protein